MTRKQRRLSWVGSLGLVLAVAVGLMLYALRTQIAFALTPSELVEKQVGPNDRIRLFGLVKENTVVRGEGLNVKFDLTDTDKTITVEFNNILPDLFREGQGIITEGVLGENGIFQADIVLAKHDENYIPKELEASLKEKGMWQGESE